MSVNNDVFRRSGVIALLALLFICKLAAAPRGYGYNDDSQTAVREMRDTIEFLRHEVENHEAELRMFEERVNNQEQTIASLRQQVLDANQANKDLVKSSAANWDGRIAGVESANKGLVADLKQLKTHANDSGDAISHDKQRISELEKIVSMQNQNIDNLQAAMGSLMEALKVKDGVALDSSKEYRVRSGDSLDKIARMHNTTVRAIKELNNLPNDRIVVGKVLIMP